jgi:hypothetical protein
MEEEVEEATHKRRRLEEDLAEPSAPARRPTR